MPLAIAQIPSCNQCAQPFPRQRSRHRERFGTVGEARALAPGSCFLSHLTTPCRMSPALKGLGCVLSFTPERYELCPVSFFRRQSAKIFFRCSRQLHCLRRPRMTSPPATRSIRPSTTRPTSSPSQGLNNRACDIGNLLDSIGNGVQVLQAANTGITSLQSLVSSAQSIANQVLQTPVGYSTKSNVTSAADLRRNRQQPARTPRTSDLHRYCGRQQPDHSALHHGATELVSATNRTRWPPTPANGSIPSPSTARPSPSDRPDRCDHRYQRQRTIGVGTGSTQTVGVVLKRLTASPALPRPPPSAAR